MALRPVHGLALCAGAGTLELGVRLALGPRYRTVAHVERDPFAAAVLVARMEDQTMDQAPVWDDLRTFDGRPWRGTVDLVSAGFPCQPFSAAGQRRGLDDDRWLWPDVARVVREVEPALVFVENVRGFLAEHGGLGAVLGDLADLGFDAEWQVLSAGEVGATHRRERFWLLAHRDSWRREAVARGGLLDGVGTPRGDDADRQGGARVDDPGGTRRPEDTRSAPRHEAADGGRSAVNGHVADRAGEDVAHADDGRGAIRTGSAHRAGNGVEPADAARHLADTASAGLQGRGLRGRTPERCPFPPGPDDQHRWAAILTDDPSVEPAVHRMADGLACRVERSHLIGNGVVPLVAAVAFLSLARRAGLLDENVEARR